jgi:hypothetical protein
MGQRAAVVAHDQFDSASVAQRLIGQLYP